MKFPGPSKGVTDAVGSEELPDGALLPDGIRNMRYRRATSGPEELVQRAGLERYIPGLLPGPIQAMVYVGVATASTFTQGEPVALAGGYAVPDPNSATPQGCAFVVHPRQGLAASLADPDDATYPNPDGGPVAFSDNELDAYYTSGAYCTIVDKDYGGAVGVKRITRVHYFTSVGGSVLLGTPLQPVVAWSADVEDIDVAGTVGVGAVAVEARAVIVYEPYVIVIANQYIYVYAATTPAGTVVAPATYMKRYDLSDRASKLEWITFSYRATTATSDTSGPNSGVGNWPWIQVGYTGKRGATGVVSIDTYAQGAYFRSGIADYMIRPDVATQPLQKVATRYNAAAAANDESTGDWRTYRLESDLLRGRLMYHAAAWKGVLRSVDGTVPRTLPTFVHPTARPIFCCGTNTGFGRAASQDADGSTGYKTTWQLRGSDLTLTPLTDRPVWFAVDPWNTSIRVDWQGTGLFNDIAVDENLVIDPDNGHGPEGSHTAVALDHNRGNLWVGGSVVRGANVYQCDGDNGAVFGVTSVGALVPQGCMCFDSAQDRVVVGGIRNTSWTGASGRNAHLWWIDANDRSIADTFDLGVASVAVRNVAVNRAGWVIFSTFEYVT